MVAVQLDTVEAGFLDALRGVGVFLDDLADLVLGKRTERPVPAAEDVLLGLFGNIGGADPNELRPARARRPCSRRRP